MPNGYIQMPDGRLVDAWNPESQDEPILARRGLSSGEKNQILFQKAPTAALATGLTALLAHKGNLKHIMNRTTLKQAGLVATGAAGADALYNVGRQAVVRHKQKSALKMDPLKPGETLNFGPEGKRGVWRNVNGNSIFIEVRRGESIPQAIRRQ